MTLVTRESLQAMLSNPSPAYVQKVIGRALVALLERQTAAEQSSAAVMEANGVGFTGADGYSGTLTAKYWAKHNRLEPWMVEKWTKPAKSGFARLTKYHKQLNEIAQNKG